MAVIGGYAGSGGSLLPPGNPGRQVDLARLLTAFIAGRPQTNQILGSHLNNAQIQNLIRQIIPELASAFPGHVMGR